MQLLGYADVGRCPRSYTEAHGCMSRKLSNNLPVGYTGIATGTREQLLLLLQTAHLGSLLACMNN